MPPRRHQIRPQNAEPEPPRETLPPDDPEGDRSSIENDQDEDDDTTQSSPLPFYNTTFSAHRISPLYLGSEGLTPNRLQLLAHRLRDKLAGDVVRGVEIGGADREDSVMGRAGALERVDISWVSVADVLGFSREDVEVLEDDEDTASSWRLATRGLRGKRALHIAVRYETASCTALMLPSLQGEDGSEAELPDAQRARFWVGDATATARGPSLNPNPSHFLSLPLLLLRMPGPLKTVISDFLTTTFDCRVSPMRLGTRSLVGSWECWLKSAGLLPRGHLSKDVVLSLGFYVPETSASAQASDEDATVNQQQPLGIKSIDVIVPATELRKFVAAGRRVGELQDKQPVARGGLGWEGDLKKRRRLAGRLYEEGWEWRAGSPGQGSAPATQPFMEALAYYLKEQLGLNLFHPGVRVIKIACGGFAMSESRLKLFAPVTDAGVDHLSSLAPRCAVLELVGGLAHKAQIRTVTG
ncbi:kinetochore complex Sim4 subunit Fta1-domain-containing protein [Corynascus novoguineensis]|uniref:Kinetochore complex Sim4 subunit Fta1-domain-containing protein n=1 Tax=Corynascus novoguineensis TaxID=1126955 RepID=A0AAN7HM02_9PEZI|nr:kinetochore complex Sim4 subunit Fta1-domain-containing protein [Corynascus novoguineensis]